ncbi:hypothetical protein NDU88_003492 [Pleurodeles waltl]|uniref:Uncharacterized protein n=1 Tax=Pleurodeles waltl TaxID=8319 RepID=A0AAV7UDV0_PLEWA|nr:hypothetical protein NDU88_003492 [Pleurodeles waltl]
MARLANSNCWLSNTPSERGVQGAGRHRSSWREKTPRRPTKTPLRGGTERRRNRDRQKPWKTAAKPGEPNERAATLQEKRGLSRYGVRDKGDRAGDGRREVRKGTGKGQHKGMARGALGGKENKRGGKKRGARGRKEDRRESEKKKEQQGEIYIYMNPEKQRQRGKQENDKKGRKRQQGQEENSTKREPGKNKGEKRKRQEKDT